MSRFAKYRRVFYFEEAVFSDRDLAEIEVFDEHENLKRVVCHLPTNLTEAASWSVQMQLIDQLLATHHIQDYNAWYYTPMALPITEHLKPRVVIYDCMDELSCFKNAPPLLRMLEEKLLARADVVFTGGYSLFEAKVGRHDNIHAFPSSIDVAHFKQARLSQEAPADQAGLPRPRIGYCGVIDERMDLALLEALASLRPQWQFVMIGPVVKIDPATLPQGANLHYLGLKTYDALPSYLSGWSLAILPFARNEATRYISPTKTPEYLAAGCPVVSTSIQDVIRPYAHEGLIFIADTAEQFVARAEQAMNNAACPDWISKVDQLLSKTSWDETWQKMALLELKAARARAIRH